MKSNQNDSLLEGILLVDKPEGITSFRLVQILRRHTGIKKIGHAGTLDPFATGLMVMLIGRRYTRLSDTFLCQNKEYIAEVFLGTTTNTYDCEGIITEQSSYIPSLEEIFQAIQSFQGEILQTPPMFSAKKKEGKKLYELARKGIEIPRESIRVTIETHFIHYEYPYLALRVVCSKGTYIRTLGYDLGKKLGCGAHLTKLRRIRSGNFFVQDSIPESQLHSPSCVDHLQRYSELESIKC